MGRIRDERPTALGHSPARQEVYPRRTKTMISDIRGRHVVAVALQHARDGAGAAAWLPNSPAELNVTK